MHEKREEKKLRKDTASGASFVMRATAPLTTYTNSKTLSPPEDRLLPSASQPMKRIKGSEFHSDSESPHSPMKMKAKGALIPVDEDDDDSGDLPFHSEEERIKDSINEQKLKLQQMRSERSTQLQSLKIKNATPDPQSDMPGPHKKA